MTKIFIYLTIILFLLLIATNMPKIKQLTGYAVKEQKETEETNNFSTYTKAVCENNEEGINCQDVLFITCGEMEQSIELPNSSRTFSEDWKDPRE